MNERPRRENLKKKLTLPDLMKKKKKKKKQKNEAGRYGVYVCASVCACVGGVRLKKRYIDRQINRQRDR